VEGQPEFLGRCTATPLVKLDEEAYDPAQLDWFDLYRGPLKAGQLLASFELLEASQATTARPEFEVWGTSTLGDGRFLAAELAPYCWYVAWIFDENFA